MTPVVQRRAIREPAICTQAPSARRRTRETEQVPTLCVGPSSAAPNDTKEENKGICVAQSVLPHISHGADKCRGHTNFLAELPLDSPPHSVPGSSVLLPSAIRYP